jgi:hypothetical protein
MPRHLPPISAITIALNVFTRAIFQLFPLLEKQSVF